VTEEKQSDLEQTSGPADPSEHADSYELGAVGLQKIKQLYNALAQAAKMCHPSAIAFESTDNLI